MHTEAQYRVAIVGGGVAGLTLALACEQLQISYILLEAKPSIVQEEGASVGLQPNGLIVLDQLGVLDKIEDKSSYLHTWRHVNGNGDLLSTIHALKECTADSSLTYGVNFFARSELLKAMYTQIKYRAAVQAAKRVVAISTNAEFATVHVDDGSAVTAELVIGADGVHSCVRRHIDSTTSVSSLPVLPALSSEFACVFGMSDAVSGVSDGEAYSLYCEHAAVILFTGKNGRLFWFVVEPLGQLLPYAKTPRYTRWDAEKACLSVSHLRMNSTACFKDVWESRTAAFKIGLEEGMAPTWVGNRAVLVGDACHKMVPALAMGANQAIGSAAVLINELFRLFSKTPTIPAPLEALQKSLNSYTEQRQEWVRQVIAAAGMGYRWQLSCGLSEAAKEKQVRTFTDAGWGRQVYQSFLNLPVVEALPLTERGHKCQQALRRFSQADECRRSEADRELP
ncbi:hypothetical protein BJX64DRAFT_302133 [Aspergillus heterothallicus]